MRRMEYYLRKALNYKDDGSEKSDEDSTELAPRSAMRAVEDWL